MLNPDSIFAIIMGFLIAWFIEKYYIGRLGVLPNVAGIFFILSPYWSNILDIVKYWMYLGILLGIITLIFILNKKRLHNTLYDLAYPLYSGKTIMGIYTSIVIFKEYFPVFLFSNLFWVACSISIIVIWYIGIKFFKNDKPLQKYLR